MQIKKVFYSPLSSQRCLCVSIRGTAPLVVQCMNNYN